MLFSFQGTPVGCDTEDEHCTGKYQQCNKVHPDDIKPLSPENNSSECIHAIVFGLITVIHRNQSGIPITG